MKCPRDNAELLEAMNGTYRCPECDGILVHSTKHHFFDKVMKLKTVQDSELNCPKSGLPMKEINLKGVVVDFCLTSKYVWLDQGELEKLIRLYPIKGVVKKATDNGSSVVDVVTDVIVDNVVIDVAGAVFDGLASLVSSIDIDIF